MAVLVIPEFAMDLKEYAELIRRREQARVTAEKLKLQTSKAWRKYYDIERDISKANDELGLDRIFVEENFNVPPNTPVKKKGKRKLDEATVDAVQLKFDSE